MGDLSNSPIASDWLRRTAAMFATRSLVRTAANGGSPPFVLDILRHAAPSTNVVEGLETALRRVLHQSPLSTEWSISMIGYKIHAWT